MYVPKYWVRWNHEGMAYLGWSDESLAAAERHACERFENMQKAQDATKTPEEYQRFLDEGWDYYPNTPVKEEILSRPQAPGVTLLITRNRAGVQVLNTDRVAFVDIDLPAPRRNAGNFLKRLFGKPAAAPDPAAAAVEIVRIWAENNNALLRAYRTTRGLRLLRMDQLMDPAGDETGRFFTALGTDPQYSKLCRVQKSFRARLTPKPKRVDCPASPGSHPRTEPALQAAFAAWLTKYEQLCRNRPVCAHIANYGGGRPVAAARAVAELHDRMTLQGEGPLV